MVGEHSYGVEGPGVSQTGAIRRENVGMSNRKAGEKPAPRKSKDSSSTKIGRGLGGPKWMAKAAHEGQQVNIPAPQYICDGGTKNSSSSILMVWCFALKGEV